MSAAPVPRARPRFVEDARLPIQPLVELHLLEQIQIVDVRAAARDRRPPATVAAHGRDAPASRPERRRRSPRRRPPVAQCASACASAAVASSARIDDAVEPARASPAASRRCRRAARRARVARRPGRPPHRRLGAHRSPSCSRKRAHRARVVSLDAAFACIPWRWRSRSHPGPRRCAAGTPRAAAPADARSRARAGSAAVDSTQSTGSGDAGGVRSCTSARPADRNA